MVCLVRACNLRARQCRHQHGMPHLGFASTWRTAAAAILQVRCLRGCQDDGSTLNEHHVCRQTLHCFLLCPCPRTSTQLVVSACATEPAGCRETAR